MKRLKDLDVLEVSIVEAGANGKKYAVVKNAKGIPMPTHDEATLLDLFQRIPKERIEAIQAVAKSAKARVRKADDIEDGVASSDDAADEAPEQADNDGGLSENAQNAVKAAGRILAPYADELDRDVMDALGDALDLEGSGDDDQSEAADDAEDAAEEAVDDVGKADDDDNQDPDANADDDVTKDDDSDSSDDDDKDAAQKADDGAEVDNQKDEVDGDVSKDDDIGGGMPDFADASTADKEAAMAAARSAYASMMKERGVGGDEKQAAQKTAEPIDEVSDKKDTDAGDEPKQFQKSAAAIEKSAMSALKSFPPAQRKGLATVLKSTFGRMAELENAHRSAVNKSRKLEGELLRKEFVAKAAKLYPSLGPSDEVGEKMMRLHQKDPEGLVMWEGVMKTAQAAASAGGEAGLFSEVGSRMANTGAGSAYAKIQAHVDSVVQKSGASKSREQIESDFYTTPMGKSLYSQFQREAEKGKR